MQPVTPTQFVFRTLLSLFAIWSISIVPTCAQQVRAQSHLEAAINRAVRFLVSQQHAKGSIADRGHENAMTSLAIMALASVGHQPTDATLEATAMKKGLRFVLSSGRQDKEGYFGASDGSRMYGHGIVTLMLSEMIGMGGDDSTDDALSITVWQLMALRSAKNSGLVWQPKNRLGDRG